MIHGAPEVVRFTIDPGEQSSGAGESHPRALTEPYVNLSIHPALIVQPLTVRGASVQTDGGAPSLQNGFALYTRLIPSLVDPRIKPDDATPSVQCHYSPFIPTTNCSAPVPRIGTLSLVGATHLEFSLNIEATGSQVPHKSLSRRHATFMPDAIWAVNRSPPDLSRSNEAPPVSTSSISFRHLISGSLTLVSS